VKCSPTTKPCLAHACVPATGKCATTAANEGAACDDGDAKTAGDVCAAGVCKGQPALVGCSKDGDCPDDGDGNPCTALLCGAGVCAKGLPNGVTCADDGNACTDDTCDAASGCVHPPNSATCTDGDSCTVGDSCVGGACKASAIAACNDENPCTNDACKAASGCVHPPNSATCTDGDSCTLGDSCVGGACKAGSAATCDDQNPCTTDACDKVKGCGNAKVADGSPCPGAKVCKGGVCSDPPKCAGAAECDDGNACTDDVCEPATGCKSAPNSKPCDDGQPCTGGDTCQGGSCKAGAAAQVMQIFNGTGPAEQLHALAPTPDGGWVGVGPTNGLEDAWLVRFDAKGSIVGEYTFGGPSGDEEWYGVAAKGDGTYAAAGFLGPTGARDGWFVRLDASGNKLGEKVFAGAGNNDGLWTVTRSEAGWIVAGQTNTPPAVGDDGWILGLDEQGNKLWDARPGGSGGDHFLDVVALPGAGALAAGRYGVAGLTDGWLLWLDGKGQITRARLYGAADQADGITAVRPAPSVGSWPAGWFTVGETGPQSNPDGQVMRLDLAGDVLWSRVLPGSPKQDYFEGVVPQPDGGVVVAGSLDMGSYSSTKISVARLDAAGNIQWQHTTGDNGAIKIATDLLPVAKGAPGGEGFVAAGWAHPGGNSNAALFVRMDAWGYFKCGDSGKCGAKSPAGCDDGNACTADDCTPGDGKCSNTNHIGTCDALQCSVGDACSAGVCKSSGKGKLWTKDVDLGNGQQYAWSLVGDGKGGVVALMPGGGGNASRVEAYDSSGANQWQQILSPAPNGKAAVVRSIDRAPDGSFVVGGEWQAPGGAMRYTATISANGSTIKPYPEDVDGSGDAVASDLSWGWWLVGGTESAYGSGLSTQAYAARYSGDGKLAWAKYFGGPLQDGFQSVVAVPGGQAVAGGYTKSKGAGELDTWLVGIGPNGEELWNVTHGGPKADYIKSLKRSPAGGYIACGLTQSKGTGSHNAWLLKVGETGKLEWDQVWSPEGPGAWVANSVDVLPDGYLVAGVRGAATTDAFKDEAAAVVARTDLAGNKLWEWTLDGPKWDSARAVLAAPDGSIFVGGERGTADNYDAWVAHIDAWGKGTCPLAGACASIPFGSCKDGPGPCTTAGCDAIKGCKPQNKPLGTACDDGQPCTVDDVCLGGTCAPGLESLWNKGAFPGANVGGHLWSAATLKDGTIIAVGRTNHDFKGHLDGWYVLVGQDGEVKLNQTLKAGPVSASYAGQNLEFYHVVATPDGNASIYGYVGNSWQDPSAVALAIDPKTGTFVPSFLNTPGFDHYAAASLNDGGFVHRVGRAGSNGADAFSEVLTLKSGAVSPSTFFGGPQEDYFNHVIASTDGGALAVGATTIGGNLQGLAVRLDDTNKALWQKNFGGPGQEVFSGAVPAHDGNGFVLVGRVEKPGGGEASSDVWVVRVDALGKELWQQTFGDSAFDTGTAIAPFGSGYVMAANTAAAGNLDARLYYLNAAGGQLAQKKLSTPKEDELFDVVPAGNALLAVGTVRVIGVAEDGWLVRVDAFGNANCTGSGACLKEPACDDANPCTADLCDAKGCSHLAALDGTACEAGKTCIAGKCPQ